MFSSKFITVRLSAERAAELKEEISKNLRVGKEKLEKQEEKWEEEKLENLEIINVKIKEIHSYVENNKIIEAKEEKDSVELVPVIDMDFISDLEQLAIAAKKDLERDDLLSAEQIAVRTEMLIAAHQLTITPNDVEAGERFEKAAEIFSDKQYIENSWMSPLVECMLKKTGAYVLFGAASILAMCGIIRMGIATGDPCKIIGSDSNGNNIHANGYACLGYSVGTAIGSAGELMNLLFGVNYITNKVSKWQPDPIQMNLYEKSKTQKILACSARQFAKTARMGYLPSKEVVIEFGQVEMPPPRMKN